MNYLSTRGDGKALTSSEAILMGIAPDGGLYVPEKIPKAVWSYKALSRMSYPELAYEVMRYWLTDYTPEELKVCVNAAYDDKFDTKDACFLREAGGVHYLELYHGRTIAFKDMALSLLPHLMTTAMKKQGMEEQIVILTATSGDTGKAALAGFADVPGTKIIVFYPKHGVSAIQEKQMVTQEGDNTCVIGIEGNFDDAQTGVKKIFTDAALKEELREKGYRFSSANSINIGRLVPQIVYYVYAYSKLCGDNVIKEGDPVNFVVPTGNFGNILAAYYAKEMGLPVGKLICASNSNKVLFDFFRSGTYDRNRDFVLTASPSMDILISSNLERLIYHVAGNDTEKNAALMDALSSKGRYEISDEMRKKLDTFYGNYASEEETADAIRRLYHRTQYLIDTHTAVAEAVLRKYEKDTKDDTPAVVVSTASPFKFTRAVLNAIDGKPFNDSRNNISDFDLADDLSVRCGLSEPDAVLQVRNAPVRHTTVCGIDEMEGEVKKFLGM